MTMEIESGTGLAELMPVLKNGKWVKNVVRNQMKKGREKDENRLEKKHDE